MAQEENEDVAQKFVTMLEEDIKSMCQKFVWPKKMVFGERKKVEFENSDICWICIKRFQCNLKRQS